VESNIAGWVIQVITLTQRQRDRACLWQRGLLRYE